MSDNMIRLLVEYRGAQYMKASDIKLVYHISISTISEIVKEMEACGRYKDRWITINEEGTRMINTLILEDYMRYRTVLKNRNLARKIPPYDPVKVREERGDVKVLYADAEKAVPEMMAKYET